MGIHVNTIEVSVPSDQVFVFFNAGWLGQIMIQKHGDVTWLGYPTSDDYLHNILSILRDFSYSRFHYSEKHQTDIVGTHMLSEPKSSLIFCKGNTAGALKILAEDVKGTAVVQFDLPQDDRKIWIEKLSSLSTKAG